MLTLQGVIAKRLYVLMDKATITVKDNNLPGYIISHTKILI